MRIKTEKASSLPSKEASRGSLAPGPPPRSEVATDGAAGATPATGQAPASEAEAQRDLSSTAPGTKDIAPGAPEETTPSKYALEREKNSSAQGQKGVARQATRWTFAWTGSSRNIHTWPSRSPALPQATPPSTPRLGRADQRPGSPREIHLPQGPRRRRSRTHSTIRKISSRLCTQSRPSGRMRSSRSRRTVHPTTNNPTHNS